MSGGSDSQRPEGGDGRQRVDARAKATFVAGIRDGLPRDEAARRAGFSANAFYYARRKDPVFRLAWEWANALSAADERRDSALEALRHAPPDEVAIVPNANRPLQRRRVRRPPFDDRRKRIFLDHFASTADFAASAAAAGVSRCTVNEHRRKDPAFAAACEEALALCVAELEAEALRQRMEAQRRLRDRQASAGEATREFDRMLRLIESFRRRGGGVGFREIGAGRQRRWPFREALIEFDRRLRALGARHGVEAEPIPREAGEDEDEDVDPEGEEG